MQLALFETTAGAPEGFIYRPELLTPEEEAALIAALEPLPFKPFEFRGYRGRRQTASYGWRYDYAAGRAEPAEPLPPPLLPLRQKAAAFAGLPAETLAQALVTLYEPGAPIGWHRDKPQFAEVIGISLGAPCAFRFRRPDGAGWRRWSFVAEPRSAYLLAGPARTAWEHSIPPVEARRFSVTFRSLAR